MTHVTCETTYYGNPGARLDDAVAEVVSRVDRMEMPAILIFNDTQLRIKPGDSAADVCATWREKRRP